MKLNWLCSSAGEVVCLGKGPTVLETVFKQLSKTVNEDICVVYNSLTVYKTDIQP